MRPRRGILESDDILAKHTACECRRTISCFVALRLFSLRDSRLDAARIQAPYSACSDIREPYRSEANSDRIATGASELLHNFSNGWIDSRDRKFEGRNPN